MRWLLFAVPFVPWAVHGIFTWVRRRRSRSSLSGSWRVYCSRYYSDSESFDDLPPQNRR